MFGELRDRANDPAVCWVGYHPPAKCKIDDVNAWHAGNPGLRTGIKSLSYMQDMARSALASPADQSKFRAYDLNLPQSPSRATIVSVDEWDACEIDSVPERDGECVVGLGHRGKRQYDRCGGDMAVYGQT